MRLRGRELSEGRPLRIVACEYADGKSVNPLGALSAPSRK